MLQINKLSAPQQAKPHPYMRHVYQSLYAQARDLSGADGTLVQSFRSIEGKYGTPGWIWFNTSQLSPFMRVAELVLLRKTLYHKPLSVMVTVHSLSPGPDNLSISCPLAEHLLSLDRLPPSGYDVFDVTAAITQPPHHSDVLGFQLCFGDESGSLVLHEALTQSLYCLNGSSLSQPLLVVYRSTLMEHQPRPRSQMQTMCICDLRNDKQQALLYTAQNSSLNHQCQKHQTVLAKLVLPHFIETAFEHRLIVGYSAGSGNSPP
uniref:Uncharacterized protein n=1 Tax=Cyprinus carpio TaxID=7962 RepID=A0A8C1ULU3_CYPCA